MRAPHPSRTTHRAPTQAGEAVFTRENSRFSQDLGMVRFGETSADPAHRPVQPSARTPIFWGMPRPFQRILLACTLSALIAYPAIAQAKHAVSYSPSTQRSFDAVLTAWAPIARTPGGKSVFTLQPKS